jgi:hypothetical protein
VQEEGLTAEGLDVLAIFAVPFGIGAFEGVVWHQPRALRTAGTRLLPLLPGALLVGLAASQYENLIDKLSGDGDQRDGDQRR